MVILENLGIRAIEIEDLAIIQKYRNNEGLRQYFREYREFLEINSIINYKHGPVHYRRPDTMMAKMIRQMLPFDRKPSGKLAFARLRTYIGAPNDTKPIEKIQFEKALITRAASNYTPLAEICRVIGWTE